MGFPNDENEQLEIYNSCGAVFQNHLMIFGGQIDTKQGIDYQSVFFSRFVYLLNTLFSPIKFFESDQTFKKISSFTFHLWNALTRFRSILWKELVILLKTLQESGLENK